MEQLILFLVYAAKMKNIFKWVKAATEKVEKIIQENIPTEFLLYL